MQKLYFATIPSTNTQLKELLCSDVLEEFLVLQAGFQTAGRGQKGNFWESKSNENLTFSVLLKPFFVSIEKQFILSQIVSLALKETLEVYIQNVRIKWPNDIYYNDAKLCGILIENMLEENLMTLSIVGIGLNVNQIKFESDAPNPISLANILGRKLDTDVILDVFIHKLIDYYSKLKNKDQWISVHQEYLNALYRNDGEYLFEDNVGRFYATIETVDDEGFFYLRKIESNKICKYAFKEVKYIL